jgi:hypothetical protein
MNPMPRSLMLVFVLAMTVAVAGAAGIVQRPAEAEIVRQATDGCGGSWRLTLTFEGRDLVEETLAVFNADGQAALHSPAVVPALPGTDTEPFYASDAIGSWNATDANGCTFDAVRLLAAEDGTPLGSVYIRGTLAVDESGAGMDGTFTWDQATGFGKTVRGGTGTVTGAAISR